jgi:hypothetical protein
MLKRKKLGETSRSVVSAAARLAVDEGAARGRAGVVADRQALGAGERADDDLGIVLLDQLARAGERDVGLGVRASRIHSIRRPPTVKFTSSSASVMAR